MDELSTSTSIMHWNCVPPLYVQLCSCAVVQRKPDLTLVCRNLYYRRLTRREPTLKRALFGSRLYVHAICANWNVIIVASWYQMTFLPKPKSRARIMADMHWFKREGRGRSTELVPNLIPRTAFEKAVDVKNIHRPYLRMTLYVIHQSK